MPGWSTAAELKLRAKSRSKTPSPAAGPCGLSRSSRGGLAVVVSPPAFHAAAARDSAGVIPTCAYGPAASLVVALGSIHPLEEEGPVSRVRPFREAANQAEAPDLFDYPLHPIHRQHTIGHPGAVDDQHLSTRP